MPGPFSKPSTFGAMVLREQHTASASPTLDFTAWYSGTYDEYVIEIINVVNATTGQGFNLTFSTNGGSSYDASAIYAWSSLEWSTGGSGCNGQNTGGTFMGLARNVKSSTANWSVNGSYRIFNPGGSNFKQVLGGVSLLTGTIVEGQMISGIYSSTTAVNAFRLQFASGNITSGTVRVYGIAKV